LTDTFGTPAFFNAFRKPVPEYIRASVGEQARLPSGLSTSTVDNLADAVAAPIQNGGASASETYARVFQGIRQDSGDPAYFVKVARDFYDKEGIREKKTIVFSDSLNVDLCLEYKMISEEAGFQPVFGVGTFLTSETRP
jgi:nicotinate phosphoribosyltransferase